MAKLAIGFITYNELTAKYLPYFLKSLKGQNFQDFEVFVADNSEEENNKNKEYIKNNYPDIDFKWMGKNIGFARAYNQLIEKAKNKDCEYFLIINPDTLLEQDTIQKLIAYATEYATEYASFCPKILSWDFENNKKTSTIDSCGLIMPKALRFRDFAQGEADRADTDNKNIIGPSGACGLFKISALEKVKDEHGYFDERMFMYKEDCDLAYRLFVNNFKSKCVDRAIVYHDRTAKESKGFFESRKAKSENIKKWSLVNQQLIFRKHWDKQALLAKMSILYYQLKIFVYILFFERYLLKYFFKAKK